jgi:hypothetical protein
MDRSTLAFSVGYAAAEIAPVVRRLKELAPRSARLFADETVVRVLRSRPRRRGASTADYGANSGTGEAIGLFFS